MDARAKIRTVVPTSSSTNSAMSTTRCRSASVKLANTRHFRRSFFIFRGILGNFCFLSLRFNDGGQLADGLAKGYQVHVDLPDFVPNLV